MSLENLQQDRVPIDGGLFTMDNYLNAMQKMDTGNNREFYKTYDLHLRYFTSIYGLEGSDEIKKLFPILMRTCYEFGKCALCRTKDGRYVVINVAKLELDIDNSIITLEGTPARIGYGVLKNQKLYKFDAKDVVFLKQNYNAFPFIYYWRDVIKNYLTLKTAAITASLASIKKFKRNVNNNSSIINDIELSSMLDPTSPTIQVISQPMSYKEQMLQAISGNQREADIKNSTTANSITFETSNSDASDQWNNLKNFLEQEYFMLGRRINTNKKNERNIAREIDTETINFDVLEQDFKTYLDDFAKEVNEKFGLSISIFNYVEKNEKERQLATQPQGGIYNENNTEEI